MKALVSRKVGDKYSEVGMSNRTLFSHLTTYGGVRRAANKWAGMPHRIEYFSDSGFYGAPFLVEYR